MIAILIESLRATMLPPWMLLLPSTIGFICLLKLSISLLKWTFTTIIRRPKNLTHYGSWALITGATDGIGKALAKKLAAQGLNLILVSRRYNKLKAVETEFLAEYPHTKITTVEFDFTGNISEGVKSVEKAIDGLEVGILINNVGITYPSAMFFHEVEEKVWMDIVRVNMEGTTRVTKAVISGMIKRRKGAIVNIGSGAATVIPSHPLFTIYAATKAYIDQLSRSLYVEYKKFGIDVQCQVPLYVATKMVSKVASINKKSIFIPSPEDYAEASIGWIGYEARCTPYWPHSLQWSFASLLPPSILDAWRLSIGIRRRRSQSQSISA